MVYFDCRNATPGDTGAGCQKSCHTLDMDCVSAPWPRWTPVPLVTPQCPRTCLPPTGTCGDAHPG